MKISKKLWAFLAASTIVAGSAYAFIVLVVVNVIPPGNCQETDGGLNFLQAGKMSGIFSAPGINATNATFVDTCASGTHVIEFVCGKNIAQQYNSLAAAVLEDCRTASAMNMTRCVNGACVR